MIDRTIECWLTFEFLDSSLLKKADLSDSDEEHGAVHVDEEGAMQEVLLFST